MKAYHEINSDELGSILANGLKRSPRGDKGSDRLIIKTDAYLDARMPEALRQRQVSRDDNVYAYIGDGKNILSIVDGVMVPLAEFINKSQGAVVELRFDTTQCYVSDLDTYDALKEAIRNDEHPDTLNMLSKSYWRKLTLMRDFTIGSIQRPEIMITYDVSAQDITPLT